MDADILDVSFFVGRSMDAARKPFEKSLLRAPADDPMPIPFLVRELDPLRVSESV